MKSFLIELKFDNEIGVISYHGYEYEANRRFLVTFVFSFQEIFLNKFEPSFTFFILKMCKNLREKSRNQSTVRP